MWDLDLEVLLRIKEMKMTRFILMLFGVMAVLVLIFAVAKHKDEVTTSKAPDTASEFVEYGHN